MAIIDNLNTLNTNLDNAKFKIAKNLKSKGVQALPSDKLDVLADKIVSIPSGSCNLQELNVVENGTYTPQAGDVKGYNKVTVNVNVPVLFDFSSIGYIGNEESLKSDLAYSKKIYDEWDATQTKLVSKFYGDEKLVYMPMVDTSIVTSMHNTYNGCRSLTAIPQLDTSKVESMYGAFKFCNNLRTIPQLNTSNVIDMFELFAHCGSLATIPQLNVSSAIDTSKMFEDCDSLKYIYLSGDPSSITNSKDMFGSSSYDNLADNGTLIYDGRYDYTKIIEELHKYNPTWTVESDYELQECTSLSITADDCIGNAITTTVHYTAVTNGVNRITGEQVSGVTLTGDGVSEPFEMNPSYDTSRQVIVTFNYFGCSATTTITQGAKLHASASVDLMSNWELAPSETIPNPDPQVYEGVYQSVHKGQSNVKDKMVITFIAMPNFELYIRSNGESSYDYVFAGKLDQAEPAEGDNQASTKGNQQSGTALENYTKVEYPNDGGQHTITIIYRKDSSGDSGDDRGYVFFKKPQ